MQLNWKDCKNGGPREKRRSVLNDMNTRGARLEAVGPGEMLNEERVRRAVKKDKDQVEQIEAGEGIREDFVK